MLKDNLEAVEGQIAKACQRAGRARSEVTLIAVSKTKPAEMIEEIYAAGIRDFGENRPQELKEKFSRLPQDIRWHQIGHLQTNKVKYVIERACMIHSVESVHLAQAVSDAAVRCGRVMPVLAEVNVAKEESKFGVMPEEACAFVREIGVLPGIRVEGLMTIAPMTEHPEENRIYFRRLRQLAEEIAAEHPEGVQMRELSMGMTGDYVIAIEEGATMVRVGTGIFGSRSYPAKA